MKRSTIALLFLLFAAHGTLAVSPSVAVDKDKTRNTDRGSVQWKVKRVGSVDTLCVVNEDGTPVGGGAVTEADGANVTLGSKDDSAATTDTGTFSLMSLFKRALQKLTTIVSTLTDGTQKSQVVNGAGTEINTATTVKSTALEASHVLKGGAGRLASLQVFNSSGSAQYILVMDSATVPANGAVTLLCPPIYIAAGTYIMIPWAIPLSAANGISVSNSSTGSFTKTIGSADCAFTGQVQ
jgi:hypothetical protein